MVYFEVRYASEPGIERDRCLRRINDPVTIDIKCAGCTFGAGAGLLQCVQSDGSVERQAIVQCPVCGNKWRARLVFEIIVSVGARPSESLIVAQNAVVSEASDVDQRRIGIC